ncbi:hypothetical protein FOCC_FOCC014110 [Frankliniella occidentalis]|nr:hypothetical protein FOCC_FOCC014110 [Frankliniella occidentalis]
MHGNELEAGDGVADLDIEIEALNDPAKGVPDNLNDVELEVEDSDGDDHDSEDGEREAEDGEDSGSEEEYDGPVGGDPVELDLFLLESLRAWARRRVSGTKVDQLLSVLKIVHPFLPMTRKTTLQTPPANNNINDVSGGQF